MTDRRCLRSPLLVVAVVALLTACGGGGSDDAPGDATGTPTPIATAAATPTATPSVAAGGLDTEFGTNGIVLVAKQADIRVPRHGLRVLADGVVEMLVLGRDSGPVRVVRARPGGAQVDEGIVDATIATEDAAFGSDDTLWVARREGVAVRIARFSRQNGVFTEDHSARVALDEVAELVPLDDGGVLVVGLWTDDRAGLQRFDASGTADPTFGTEPFLVDGLVLGPPRQGDVSIAFGGAAVRDDGSILVAGTHFEGFIVLAVVLAYDARGALDASFGTNGIATFGSIGGSHVIAAASDGSSVVGLETGGIERLDRTGAVDVEYRARTGGVLGVGGSALTFAADGELVSVGGGFGPRNVLTVARLAPGGNPDPRFGTNGVVTTEVDSAHRAQGTGYTSLALAPAGRITAAGITCLRPFVCDVVIARYEDIHD